MRTLVLLVALLALGCAGPRALARVNGDEITRHDLRAEFKRRHGGHERMLTDVEQNRAPGFGPSSAAPEAASNCSPMPHSGHAPGTV